MAPRTFTGRVEQSGRGGGHRIVVPFDAREAFGEARPPIRGAVDGTPIRSRLSVYGGTTYLGLRRELLEAAGIAVGDRVEVVLELDDEPREVVLPPELEAALGADADVRATFDALAFTHRREYADWVDGAKREPTRALRAAKAVEMLRAGVRHP